MATPMAYGSSWARDCIFHNCNLRCSCGNAGSFNPLRLAGGRICISAVTHTAAVKKKFFFFFFWSFVFLELHLQHMEVPRLGIELKLQLLAYITATTTQDPSHVCDLYNSSQQCWILNPLSEGRDQIRNFIVTSQVR